MRTEEEIRQRLDEITDFICIIGRQEQAMAARAELLWVLGELDTYKPPTVEFIKSRYNISEKKATKALKWIEKGKRQHHDKV